MRTFDIMLATLPCGDVVECGEVRVQAVENDRLVMCPWCDAVYEQALLQEWVMKQSPRPIITLVNPLAYDGKRLVKVVGMCPDGHPMVKECVHGAKVEHFRGDLVSLRN